MNRDFQTYHPESTEGQIKLGVLSSVNGDGAGPSADFNSLLHWKYSCGNLSIAIARIDARMKAELMIQLGTV